MMNTSCSIQICLVIHKQLFNVFPNSKHLAASAHNALYVHLLETLEDLPRKIFFLYLHLSKRITEFLSFLVLRKRSDLSEDTSSNKQARTFSLTYSVGGPEDIRHRKRRLFGQSDDAIDRKKNRIFFSTTNDGNDGSDDNKTNSLPAFEDETSERWKMGGSGSGEMITYHDVDMTPHNESLDTEEIKAEVVRHDENFTKSFHGKGHHHRVNKFHHKDLRKGKVGKHNANLSSLGL